MKLGLQPIKENHGVKSISQQDGHDDPAVMISKGTRREQLESAGMTEFMKNRTHLALKIS